MTWATTERSMWPPSIRVRLHGNPPESIVVPWDVEAMHERKECLTHNGLMPSAPSTSDGSAR